MKVINEDKNIEKKDIYSSTTISIVNWREALSIIAVFILILAILQDPFNLSEEIYYFGRIQCMSILAIIIIYNTGWMIYKQKNINLFKIIALVIMYSFLFFYFWVVTTPIDENKVSLDKNQFKIIMQNHNYSVKDITQEDKISCDAEIILEAKNNDTKFIYYKCRNKKDAEKLSNSIYEFYIKKYSDRGTSIVIGNYKEKNVDNKVWFVSKIKDTIIFGETRKDNKILFEEMIDILGYNYKAND